jgi:hypothetical protein
MAGSRKRRKMEKSNNQRPDSKMLTRRMKALMSPRMRQKLSSKLMQTLETRRCTTKKARRLLKIKFSESID